MVDVVLVFMFRTAFFNPSYESGGKLGDFNMTLPTSFKIVNRELSINSNVTGKVIWKGKPKGYDVTAVLPIDGEDEYIVLVDWLKSGLENQKNLLRLDPYGNIVWEVGDPQIQSVFGLQRGQEVESYTQILIKNSQLIATSYSCFVDYIDTETGCIIKSEFVK